MHNVVECPLTQMRNQGSCFQIHTYCFKKKLNGKQCFLLYPLAVLSILFWTSFVLFDFIFIFLFWLQVLLVSFTPTYVFSYFWLKINSILSVSSCVTSYSFEMDIENKFYICSPCIASFWFLVFFLPLIFFCEVFIFSSLCQCWTNAGKASRLQAHVPSQFYLFFFFCPVVQLSRVSVWALCGGLKIQVCQTAGGGCDMRPKSLQVFCFF